MQRISTILIVSTLLSFAACKSSEQRDLLLGHWQVEQVFQDGQSIVGKGFQGTHYDFRADGIVASWNQKGDTNDVQYLRRADTLFWVTQGENVAYMIDSLDENYLQLSARLDGINSVVGMRRRDADGE